MLARHLPDSPIPLVANIALSSNLAIVFCAPRSDLDIVFQHTDGTLAIWFMEGIILRSSTLFPQQTGDANWKVVGAGDFNLDAKIDLAFQHTDGTLAVWYLDGISMTEFKLLSPSHPGDAQWRVKAVNDQNGDLNPKGSRSARCILATIRSRFVSTPQRMRRTI